MRFFVSITLLFTAINTLKAQPVEQLHVTDTVRLHSIWFTKVVAYELNEAVIYVDYQKFLSSFKKILKQYRKGAKISEATKSTQSNDVSRYQLLDSVYKAMETIASSNDTIFIRHSLFDRSGFGALYDFSEDMDKGDCAIRDRQKKWYRFLLRETVAIKKDLPDAWGGRKYFIPGEKKHFFSVTDWLN
jgi:hypothetical protein